MKWNSSINNLATNPLEALFDSVVDPSMLIQARYLCSKIHSMEPALAIMVGMWGRVGLSAGNIESLRASGADAVVTTFAEALGKVASLRSDAGARK